MISVIVFQKSYNKRFEAAKPAICCLVKQVQVNALKADYKYNPVKKAPSTILDDAAFITQLLVFLNYKHYKTIM
jgi:hypothetical protein